MALWGAYELVKGVANTYKRRRPKRKHFKVMRHKGLIARAMGVDPSQWWIFYKPDERTILGPFETKADAEEILTTLLTELGIR